MNQVSIKGLQDQLRRIEEKAAQLHAVLTDCDRRRSEARAAYLDLKNKFEISLYGYPAIEAEIKARWLDAQEHIVGPALKQTMREIDALKGEYDRLTAEYNIAEERWCSAAACLPSLREFAKSAEKLGGL
jgi:septation ring formation regulator EzrA